MPARLSRLVDTRVPRARTLRRDVTEAEKKLWQHLRQPPFKPRHFRRQATIGPFFCDFASHQLKLVIELDGGQHAESASDIRRTAYLAEQGYRVLRFWNHDVMQNVEGVLAVIAGAISDSPPPPTPPHRKRVEGSHPLSQREGSVARDADAQKDTPNA